MSSDRGEEVAKWLVGFVLHTMLCVAGTAAFGLVLGYIIGGISVGLTRPFELVPFLIANVLLGAFAASRWFRSSAPWVGILGLIALAVGAHELWTSWSPTWSHETRRSYVLSQLFGLYGGCSDSECLYFLLWGMPFLCFCSYSAASLVALWFTRTKRDGTVRA